MYLACLFGKQGFLELAFCERLCVCVEMLAQDQGVFGSVWWMLLFGLLCVYMGVFSEWVEAPMCFCGCHSASVCEPVPDGSAAFLDRSDWKLGPGSDPLCRCRFCEELQYNAILQLMSRKLNLICSLHRVKHPWMTGIYSLSCHSRCLVFLSFAKRKRRNFQECSQSYIL